MKAVICREFGPIENLVWDEGPALVCGANQVRLRTRFATVGFMDTLMVRGLYQHKPQLPFIPGAVSAGVITEVGSQVQGLHIGQVVTASDYGGAYAEERVVGVADVEAVPEGMDDLQAAALRLTFVPSYLALVHRARLQTGETLVVTGATGGIGFAAMQLGRHLGARVIGAAGSAEKTAFLKEHGFTETIDYSAENFKDRVNEFTSGMGADVIFEVVGGDLLDQSLRCINQGGRVLVLGFTSGRIPSVSANLPLLKNAAIMGSFLGGWRRRHPQEFAEVNREIRRILAQTGMHTPIARRFPLAQAAQAMKMVVDRRAVGVVALTA
jgi:NADPH:quinone reductase